LGVAGAFPKAAGLKSWLAGPRSYLKQGLKFGWDYLGLAHEYLYILFIFAGQFLFSSQRMVRQTSTQFSSLLSIFFLVLHFPIFAQS
jgi:hypothetical protein